MKNKKHILIFAALLLVLLAVPVWGRAGGGGSSGGGGGGGSSSGGGSYSSHSSYYRGGRGSGIAGMILQAGVVIFAAGGGSIVLIRKARAARARSQKAMAFYAQLGDNWDYREIQKQVEETYFQVQECWRRMDVSYGAPYLSQELMEEFDSKIQWMQVRGERWVLQEIKQEDEMDIDALSQSVV